MRITELFLVHLNEFKWNTYFLGQQLIVAHLHDAWSRKCAPNESDYTHETEERVWYVEK